MKQNTARIAYAYVMFEPSIKNGSVKIDKNINLNTVFITLKKLFTLPANSFGINENKYVTLKIREPAFVNPFKKATFINTTTASSSI